MKKVFVLFLAACAVLFFSCQKQVAEGGGDGPIFETCDDGIKNQDETGVDCGGSCPRCLGKMTAFINGLDFHLKVNEGVNASITNQIILVTGTDSLGNTLQISLLPGGYDSVKTYPLQQVYFEYNNNPDFFSFAQPGSQITFSEFNSVDSIFTATFSATLLNQAFTDTVYITNGTLTEIDYGKD